MSTIGSPIETSIVQAAQAQQSASKARDRARSSGESARRLKDMVDLRVAGVEQAGAVRELPSNDSEQAEQEHRGEDPGRHGAGRDIGPPHIDVQA